MTFYIISSTTLAQICFQMTLQNLSVQLYIFTAKLFSSKVCYYIGSKCLLDMSYSQSYVYADLFTVLQHMCSKCPPLFSCGML